MANFSAYWSNFNVLGILNDWAKNLILLEFFFHFGYYSAFKHWHQCTAIQINLLVQKLSMGHSLSNNNTKRIYLNNTWSIYLVSFEQWPWGNVYCTFIGHLNCKYLDRVFNIMRSDGTTMIIRHVHVLLHGL